MTSRDESDHADALRRTGFWGAAAAGAIFKAINTGRIGFVHRGPNVEQPNTYGAVGGAIDRGEDPAHAMRREVGEEIGYLIDSDDQIELLDVFRSGTFTYTTFLVTVPEEFRGRLNWECQGFVWVEFGQWPQPLHPGVSETLSKASVLAKLKG